VQQAGAKVAFLSERSDGVMKGLRELEDRLSDARAQVTVLNERLVRGLETHENFLGELREKNSHLQLLVGKQESELKTIIEKLNSVSDQTASVSHRLSLVETALFQLLNERKAVVEESKNYEKNRVSFIRLLLKLENQRTVRSALTRELSYELASRREAFDRHLLALKEESDLRVLSAKSRFEKDAQELQLKFEREKLSVDMAVRIEEARIESEMRMRDRRENEDVNLRELAEKNLAEKNKLAAIIQQTAEIVSSWVINVYSNPETLMLVIGSILGLVAGVYVAKEGAQLTREEIGRRLGKPELVRVTSKNSSFFSNFFSKKKELKDAFSDVVLPADLADQIKRLAVATRAARLSKTPLLNMMFYGEPGTGKTMVAKRFAEFSGLDYAIMSGGDIAPLGAQAVTEIHKLFKWVNSSRKGVVLFVDEAESFLAQRTGGMSENLRNAITALLYHTGTASSKFMMIIATNRPGDLDTAVIDRIDERIEFPLPNLGERERLVKMYFGTFVSQVKDEKVAEALKRVAVRVKGFSGREISKLMMSVNSHQYFESKCSLIELLESVTETKVREHEKIRRMASVGYAFDQSTLDCSDTDRSLSKI
jgi:ATPase family AAA domain-containing protein 3A/B